ncbi:MAG: aspartate aminotransferase family protein [Candidatus Tectomicrobia bacterium]|uniref:Aspartate aminotransferase family protein n=1 Tax=Tectimicrobiota bacterium TaxID=2528274 RepID=A0A932GPG6_UNCTE|nr:aspartate aminotransferase family protein [Candidatus Tectomicrobia bacterium]
MNQGELINLSQTFLARTYAPAPVVLVRGQGCRVWDADGKEYLDFVAGIAVQALGHCHPKVVEAIREQASRLMHVSNLYYIGREIELARLLVENSCADRVFFCNSGAEANEAAIKLARKYSRDHYGTDRYEIITMANSFHGRTLATLAATGQEKFRLGFEPLPAGFSHVPFNDLAALEKALTPRTCAVMLEPIQAEGGVIVADREYLKKVRELCDRRNLLLIFDEVQVGTGRTGHLFAYEHYGVEPDIFTLAKALGGGTAIGAMLAKEAVSESFGPGTHASTFGGNPLACAAAIAVVRELLEGNHLSQCRKMGAYLTERLVTLQKKHPPPGGQREGSRRIRVLPR